MAVIKTTQSKNKLADVLRACANQHCEEGSRVCIALSGGVDSVVLLHLFAQLGQDYPLNLSAIHVHHGISEHADAWAQTCEQHCAYLGIPLQIQRIQIANASKLGLEASARQARYEQFAHQPVDFIALAHHRDDQAETLLLQLLRGAGVKGMSAMPVLRPSALPPAYLRPLLDTDRSAIVAWAVEQQLSWVEDESNRDSRFTRNFLRHSILPLLGQHYPAWRATLARSAQHMAETAALLDDLAELDASQSIAENRIDCAALARLKPARARNLLRYFFAQHHLAMPSQICLAEMLDQLTLAGTDASIAITHDRHVLRRYQQYGYLIAPAAAPAAESRWFWQGAEQLVLPELNGTLYFKQAPGYGLNPEKLHDINIRLRQGGERFRPDCRRPNRHLKDLLQSAHIPPWERDRIPLIYSADELIQVPGIGIACGWQAAATQTAVCIAWQRHA